MITRYRDGRAYPYRCFTSNGDRNRERGFPFPADISPNITVKIYAGDDNVWCCMRLSDTASRYECRVETLPFTYAVAGDARERIHPAFAREADRILDCILNGEQYEPLKEYVPKPLSDCTPATADSPRSIRTRLARPKPTSPLPWPRVANAFLEGVRLLNRKSYGTLFDGTPPDY